MVFKGIFFERCWVPESLFVVTLDPGSVYHAPKNFVTRFSSMKDAGLSPA